MGYLRGVVHGIVIGGAAALLYAPKPGRELRAELAQRLDRMRGQMQPVLDQAQGVMEQARPQVERTISRAQQKMGKTSGSSGTAYSTNIGAGGSPSGN